MKISLKKKLIEFYDGSKVLSTSFISIQTHLAALITSNVQVP